MSIENSEDRILAAIRVVDAGTKLQIRETLHVESVAPAGVRILRNRSGYFVLTRVPGLLSYSESFVSPPPVGSLPEVAVTLKVEDPNRHYLPRLFTLRLPRDPRPENAGQPDSLFQALDVSMYPAPAAVLAPGVAALRVSLSATRGGQPAELPGALIRVLRSSGGPQPIARGLSDQRGEALVTVVGIPTMTWADSNEEHSVLAAGAMVLVQVMYDPQAGPIPDPDRLDTLSTLLPAMPYKLIAGQETIVSLMVALP